MENRSLQSHDGIHLHLNIWEKTDAIADMAFVHGFFEHSSRYADHAQYFNSEGFNFLSYDQRSHGKSGGKYRSFIKSFDNYAKDYKLFLSSLDLGKERPYFLFSHSMGGLVLCNYLIQNKMLPEAFKGAIFSAPLLKPDENTAPLLQKMAGVIGTLFPTLKTIAIDPQSISRDQTEVMKYTNDPLNYTGKMYASSGYQILKHIKLIQPLFNTFSHPFIILHGTDDKLAEINGSRLLYSQANSKDKELVELKDYKHEIMNEIGKELVLGKISQWMKNRI